MTMAQTVLRAPAPARTNADDLRGYIGRIQRLNEERANIVSDIASVYAEAKAAGFDKAALRRVIRYLDMDPGERAERQAIDDLYLQALGVA